MYVQARLQAWFTTSHRLSAALVLLQVLALGCGGPGGAQTSTTSETASGPTATGDTSTGGTTGTPTTSGPGTDDSGDTSTTTTSTTTTSGATSTSDATSTGDATSTPPDPMPVLIGHADFSDGNVEPSSIYPGTSWGSGAIAGGAISVVDGAYRADYPIPSGGVYTWLNFNVGPLELFDVYIQLRAKFIDPHSVKFVKVHGIEVGPNYSNTTYGLGMSGTMSQVSFGDGSAEANDTANVINLSGSDPSWVGRSYPDTAVILTPQMSSFTGFSDGDWHDIKIHHKFNSGTTAEDEVADGEYYVEIDGDVYVDATGLFNRHPASAAVEYIAFGDWAQGNDYAFTVFFDDIKISLGGFVP